MGYSHKQGEGTGEGGRESSIPHAGMVGQGRNRAETCPTHSRPAPESITRAYGWARVFGPDPHRSRAGPCSRICLFYDCYFIFSGWKWGFLSKRPFQIAAWALALLAVSSSGRAYHTLPQEPALGSIPVPKCPPVGTDLTTLTRVDSFLLL